MKNILVIDDDVMILDSIKRQLKNQDFKLDLEENPVNALKKLEINKYDLVICDMRMKPITGDEVLKKIKRDIPGLPVIVLTGFVDDNVMENVKKIGCDEFIIKPVRKKELIRIINSLIKKN